MDSGNYIMRCVWLALWIIVAIAYFLFFYFCFQSHYKFKSSVIIGILFLLISIIWLWSYFKLCWCDPGSTEKFFMENDFGNDELIRVLPKCNQCGNPKPARTHHCSQCNRCYFRYDHHCPIWGNCIALYNMKAFILVPIYGGILIIFLGCQLFFFLNLKFDILAVSIIAAIIMFSGCG